MPANAVHFSSETDLWSTPQDFFDKLDAEFKFETDVCAQADNAKCHRFYSRDIDGLKQDWTGTCWMNPPFGRTIGDWIKKAYNSSLGGGDCSVPDSIKDRYTVVARLLHERRGAFFARPTEVRWHKEFCAFPIMLSGVQATRHGLK